MIGDDFWYGDDFGFEHGAANSETNNDNIVYDNDYSEDLARILPDESEIDLGEFEEDFEDL